MDKETGEERIGRNGAVIRAIVIILLLLIAIFDVWLYVKCREMEDRGYVCGASGSDNSSSDRSLKEGAKMSVSKWAYEPEKCDNDYCPGSCYNCEKAKIDKEHFPIEVALAILDAERAERCS